MTLIVSIIAYSDDDDDADDINTPPPTNGDDRITDIDKIAFTIILL
tara:strand:+ start:1691 stop:1828 length:138 start_codon:yes stop_codon:yes gene_type:complete